MFHVEHVLHATAIRLGRPLTPTLPRGGGEEEMFHVEHKAFGVNALTA